jgi:hypothetical protein
MVIREEEVQIEHARSNFFRVTDERRYQEIYKLIVGQDDIRDLSKSEKGVLYHSFGCYGAIAAENPKTLNQDIADCDISKFAEELQKILHPEDAFVFIAMGHRFLTQIKTRIVTVTRDHIEACELADMISDRCNNMDGKEYKYYFE